MCFYDQYVFRDCHCFRWGRFRQHCAKENRPGETCGMKSVYETTPKPGKCNLCTKIDIATRKLNASKEMVARWMAEGRNPVSSENEKITIQVIQNEIMELNAQKMARCRDPDFQFSPARVVGGGSLSQSSTMSDAGLSGRPGVIKKGEPTKVSLPVHLKPNKTTLSQPAATSSLSGVLETHEYWFEWDTPALYRICLELVPKWVELGLGTTLILCSLGQDRYEAQPISRFLRTTNADFYRNKLMSKTRSNLSYTLRLSPLVTEIIKRLDHLCLVIAMREKSQANFGRFLVLSGLEIEMEATETHLRLLIHTMNIAFDPWLITTSRIALIALFQTIAAALALSGEGIVSVGATSLEDIRGYDSEASANRTEQAVVIPRLPRQPLQQTSDCYCWKSLFEGANCLTVDAPEPNISAPPGLKIDFQTLVKLAAITTEVSYDDGILLLGFETALIPLVKVHTQPDNIMRWHLVYTPGKQVTCDVADEFGDNRMRLKSPQHIPEIAIVGWSSNAVMLLGSDPADTLKVDKSGFDIVRSHRKAISYSKEFNLQVNPPFLGFGWKIGTSDLPLPTRSAHDPQRSHAGILNQASEMFYIIFDNENEQSWLVPAINLLLATLQIYLDRKKYIGSPSYCPAQANGTAPGAATAAIHSSAEDALADDVTYTKRNGMLGTSTSTLISVLWSRISEAEKLSRNGLTNELLNSKSCLKGAELCDIASDGELRLVHTNVRGSMKAWSGLASFIPVIFCGGIGNPIQPSALDERSPCSKTAEYPRGVLSCLNADLSQACSMSRNQRSAQPNVWKLCGGGLEWKLVGDPFATCGCKKAPASNAANGERRKTCWSTERLQEICQASSADATQMLRLLQALNKKDTSICQTLNIDIPASGAIRFGYGSRPNGSPGKK